MIEIRYYVTQKAEKLPHSLFTTVIEVQKQKNIFSSFSFAFCVFCDPLALSSFL